MYHTPLSPILREIEDRYYADLTNEIAAKIERKRASRTWAEFWAEQFAEAAKTA